jgi:hypothetical protein
VGVRQPLYHDSIRPSVHFYSKINRLAVQHLERSAITLHSGACYVIAIETELNMRRYLSHSTDCERQRSTNPKRYCTSQGHSSCLIEHTVLGGQALPCFHGTRVFITAIITRHRTLCSSPRHCDKVTNYKIQSLLWETDGFPDGQKCPCFPPFDFILSQLISLCTLRIHFLKFDFNIILSSMSRPS